MKALKKTFAAVAATTLMGVASVAQAGVIIDLFDGPLQEVEVKSVASVQSNQSSGSNIIGGYRDLSVHKIDQNSGASTGAATLSAGDGYLTFSNATGVESVGVVTWDGSSVAGDHGAGLNRTGLGGVDLTAGGVHNALLTSVIYADQGLSYSIEVWDMLGNGSRLSTSALFAVPEGSPQDADYQFSWFNQEGEDQEVLPGFKINVERLAGTGAIDFTQIGALQLVLTNLEGTSSIDLTIGAVNAVPEPGSLALVGAGLFGMAAFGRRRKAA